jgi:aryl-alcohol dehydrogenase-like predicted oxidoreductase
MNIILGTAQFGLDYGVSNLGGQVELEEVAKIISRCGELGIRHFDTARAYGNSESVLGGILKREVCITTKIPPRLSNDMTDSDWIMINLNQSLSSLRRSHIDELLFHRSSDLLACDSLEVNGILANLKRGGLIRKVGVSLYEFDDIEYLLSNYDIDIIQAPFNIIDRRLVSDGWLEFFKKRGIRVDVRSAFLQGLLLMHSSLRHHYFKRWDSIFEKLGKLRTSYPEFSKIDLCLQFLKQYSLIDNLVIGAQSEIELVEVVNSFRRPCNINFPDCSSRDVDLINPSRWELS